MHRLSVSYEQIYFALSAHMNTKAHLSTQHNPNRYSAHMTEPEWATSFTQNVIQAVIQRRKELGLSVAKLAERTKLAGYPISTSVLTNLENGRRGTRFDLVELLVLAKVLELPPGLLLFPSFPDGDLEPVPDVRMSASDALRWFSGRKLGPSVRVPADPEMFPNAPKGTMAIQASSNRGQQLVSAVEKRDRTLPEQLDKARVLASAGYLDEKLTPERLQATLNRANLLVEQLGGVVRSPQKLTEKQRDKLLSALLDLQSENHDDSDGEG